MQLDDACSGCAGSSAPNKWAVMLRDTSLPSLSLVSAGCFPSGDAPQGPHQPPHPAPGLLQVHCSSGVCTCMGAHKEQCNEQLLFGVLCLVTC